MTLKHRLRDIISTILFRAWRPVQRGDDPPWYQMYGGEYDDCDSQMDFGSNSCKLFWWLMSTFLHTLEIQEWTLEEQNRSLLNSPVIFTTNLGLLFGPVATFSIFLNVNIPSITLPKTTCFPSKKSHLAVVIKNLRKKKSPSLVVE